MANTKSAKKRIRVQATKRLRNLAVESKIKTLCKSAITQIETNRDTAQSSLKTAIVALDKAASKGILHINKVARKKSQLMKKSAKPITQSPVTTTGKKRKAS